MKFFEDIQNSKGDYCYDTFEISFGGLPSYFEKEGFNCLIIPIINQGIYGLETFNNGNQKALYVDKSYYVFLEISEFIESISVREKNTFSGEFEKKYINNKKLNNQNSYYIEMENGYNGGFLYGATWKVKSKKFGVLTLDNSKYSENGQLFYKKYSDLKENELDFLLKIEENKTINYLKNII